LGYTFFNKILQEVDNERNQRRFESVHSVKVRAGKRRTYFFDVRKTKGDDYYLTLTESTKKFNGDGYERHKLFLYKEDFNRFLAGLEEIIDHVKTELMPDYDYDEYTRRHEEYEARLNEENDENDDSSEAEVADVAETDEEPEIKSEDDMTW
jgi:hypothetical protein